MSRRFRGLAIAVVCFAAMVSAACSGSGDSSNDTESQSTAAAPVETDAAPTESGGPSGTLRVAVDFKPDNWDTLTKPNTTYTRIPYEGLVYTTPDGSEYIPVLAESWEVTPTEVTLHLREGVTFHDGTPFTADSVIANIEHIKATPNPWQHAFDSVSELVAEDDHTLVFKLSRPAPDLLGNLASRGLYMVNPTALEDGSYLEEPNGTGPWRLNKDETVTDVKYVFDAFPEYWNKEAIGPENLELYTIADVNAMYSALLAGDVDVAWIFPSMVEAAEGAGMEVLDYKMLRYHLLMYDRGEGGVLGDPLVRQAICSAIDSQAILDANFSGLGGIANQRFPDTSPAYVADLDGYDFDLAEAQRLMDEAGNPEVSFQLPFFPPVQAAHELIRENLAQIGIDVELVKMTIPQYFSEYETNKYPLIFNTSTAEDVGPYDYYNYRFAAEGAGNPNHVPPPPWLAEAVDAAANAATPEEAAEHYQEMTRLINENAIDCGYLDVPGVWAYNPDTVENIVPTVNEPSAFRYTEAIVK